jgi:hypothetical protein
MTKSLNEMSVSDVCDAIHNHIEFMSDGFKEVYAHSITEKNINGQVLNTCDLIELKSELRMAFGDWELFKSWINSKRSNQASFNTRREALMNNTKRTQAVQLPPVASLKPLRETIPELDTQQSRILNVHSPSNLPKTPAISIETCDSVGKQTGKKDVSPRSTPVTPTKSVTGNIHGRKVEFFITPVVEEKPVINKQPKPSIVNRQESIPESLESSSSTTQLIPSTSSDSIHPISRKNPGTQVTLLSFDEEEEENEKAALKTPTSKDQALLLSNGQLSTPPVNASTLSFDSNPDKSESSRLVAVRQSKYDLCWKF